MKATRSDWNREIMGNTTSAEMVSVRETTMHVVTVAMMGEERPMLTTKLSMNRYIFKCLSSTARFAETCERYACSQPIILTTFTPSMISLVTATVFCAASSIRVFVCEHNHCTAPHGAAIRGHMQVAMVHV